MEAALEMLDASGDARFAALAHQVADLFLHHIIDRKTGVLREFFTADWKPLDSAEGHIIEPGHMLEWVWILVRAHRLLGLATLDDVQRLYAFATYHGTDAHTGLIYDQIRSTGAPLSRDSRLWPQTEALKAHIAMMETFGLDTSPQISVTVDNLFRHYLDHAPWVHGLTIAVLMVAPRSTKFRLPPCITCNWRLPNCSVPNPHLDMTQWLFEKALSKTFL
ncbi:AGE family epimerase/isomerase [Komagataeibacter rhaeticus]|nr:AGE family epimerase/isomerase [Komagataeibacter rhaeticus]